MDNEFPLTPMQIEALQDLHFGDIGFVKTSYHLYRGVTPIQFHYWYDLWLRGYIAKTEDGRVTLTEEGIHLLQEGGYL